MFGFQNGGIDALIITSSANVDILLKEFERRIAKGENPNEFGDEVFEKYNIDARLDLIPSDYQRVQNGVERIWRKYNA